MFFRMLPESLDSVYLNLTLGQQKINKRFNIFSQQFYSSQRGGGFETDFRLGTLTLYTYPTDTVHDTVHHVKETFTDIETF